MGSGLSKDRAAIMSGIDQGSLNVVKTWLDKYTYDAAKDGGSKLGFVNKKGHTPLMWACKLNRKHLIKPLLAAGADPNLQSWKKSSVGSAVHVACRAGTQEVIRRLCNAGGDPFVCDLKGKTGFDYACASTVGKVDLLRTVQDFCLFCTPMRVEHYGMASPSFKAALVIVAPRRPAPPRGATMQAPKGSEPWEMLIFDVHSFKLKTRFDLTGARGEMENIDKAAEPDARPRSMVFFAKAPKIGLGGVHLRRDPSVPHGGYVRFESVGGKGKDAEGARDIARAADANWRAPLLEDFKNGRAPGTTKPPVSEADEPEGGSEEQQDTAAAGASETRRQTADADGAKAGEIKVTIQAPDT
ncbi:unnamed protein product [Pedinophyceae sp. YPF-701]|nr:unnamed protein product [Pedinophyceae sp. YPF-701]